MRIVSVNTKGISILTSVNSLFFRTFYFEMNLN